MKLYISYLSTAVIFNENFVNVLIIKNQKAFFKVIGDIYMQINEKIGDNILSHNEIEAAMDKKCEIVTDIFNFSSNKKTLTTKLYSKLKTISTNEENYIKIHELNSNIIEFFANIVDSSDCVLTFEDEIDILGVFKLLNIRFSEDYDSLSEKLIDYMLNVRELEGDKIFIFVNLKSCISSAETELFFNTVLSHKLNILLIESFQRKNFDCEKITIIDEDLCEI